MRQVHVNIDIIADNFSLINVMKYRAGREVEHLCERICRSHYVSLILHDKVPLVALCGFETKTLF